MTTTIIQNFQTYYSTEQQQQDKPSSYCSLQWRQGKLLVKPPSGLKQPYLASLERQELLVNCLKHSPTSLVRIDPKVGGHGLRFWADACEQASKPIFLEIPSAELPKSVSPLLHLLKRLVDWIFALIFLFAASPIILGLVLLMRIYSPGTVFSREWHVGVRGKLFRAIKFHTTTPQAIAYQDMRASSSQKDITPLLSWMRKYGLDNLPLLLNVLRGEMSLTGPRCQSIEDVVRLSPKGQKQLNKLPGIVGLSMVEASNPLHLDSQTL